MSVNRYKALVEVVSKGNFTKAAESLGCSQSAISQAIAALEKELDCKILKRSKGKSILTPEGQSLFPFIEKLCKDYDNMMSVSSLIRDVESGVLNVASVPSIAATLLPDLIRDFKKNHLNAAGPSFNIFTGSSENLISKVADGSADFSLSFLRGPSSLKTVHLFDVPLYLAAEAKEGDGAEEKGEISREELYSSELIQCKDFDELSLASKRLGNPLKSGNYAEDSLTAFALIEKGLGKGLFAGSYERLYGERISFLKLNPPLSLPLYLITRDQDTVSVTGQAFIGFLKGIFGK